MHLMLLIGVWSIGLVLGFGLMQYGTGSALIGGGAQPGFWTDIYLSGTTFFTLGLGDVVPRSCLSRSLVVPEGGVGLGFRAAIIRYLPFIYNSVSQRKLNISLPDTHSDTPR